MNAKSFLALLMLGCALGLFSQNTPTAGFGERHSRTLEEVLRAHNIQLTRAGLVDALRNADPEVRSVAAQKLAGDNADDTLPALMEALTVETVPSTRLNLAFAVGKFGEAKGLEALEAGCKDPSASAPLRAEAVRFMLALKQQNPACLDAAMAVLSGGSVDAKQGATWLLLQFHNLSANDSHRVLDALSKALEDPQPGVRRAASHAIGEMGDSSVLPSLQNALTRETEEDVRSAMQSDIQKLQQKK